MPDTTFEIPDTEIPSQEEMDRLHEQAIQEGLKLKENVRRLGILSGLKSIHRNLRNEDESVARSNDAADRILFSDYATQFSAAQATQATKQAEEDEMELLAGGNITINVSNPAKSEAPIPSPAPTPAPQSELPPVAAPLAEPEKITIPSPPEKKPVVERVTTIVKETQPSWLKAALFAALIGSPLLSGIINYMMMPSPTPATRYGLQVLPGIQIPKED